MMDQKVSAYNCSFITIIQSPNCKETYISLYHAKKKADAVLIYIFDIGFPATIFLLNIEIKTPCNLIEIDTDLPDKFLSLFVM